MTTNATTPGNDVSKRSIDRFERERTPDTDAAELHRLAGIARDCGIWIYRAPDGAYYCTSATDPTEAYYLSGYSCTCRAFARSQRCIHLAHLLDRLGWLPPEPATAPRPIRRPVARLLATAAIALALIAGVTTATEATAKPRRHITGNLEVGRLTADEGPTWNVVYIGRGDPRRVILADGRTGVLNCRAHRFTITNGPSYFVDC